MRYWQDESHSMVDHGEDGGVGLACTPRPTHRKHSRNRVQWDGGTGWVARHLINRMELLDRVDCRATMTAVVRATGFGANAARELPITARAPD